MTIQDVAKVVGSLPATCFGDPSNRPFWRCSTFAYQTKMAPIITDGGGHSPNERVPYFFGYRVFLSDGRGSEIDFGTTQTRVRVNS